MRGRRIVVHYQHSQAIGLRGSCGNWDGESAAAGQFKRKMEPLPGLTGQPEAAAHQFDELARNGQAKTGAAESARRRCILLRKFVENSCLIFRRYP